MPESMSTRDYSYVAAVLTFYQLIIVALKCSSLLGHHGVGVVCHLDNASHFAGRKDLNLNLWAAARGNFSEQR